MPESNTVSGVEHDKPVKIALIENNLVEYYFYYKQLSDKYIDILIKF